MAEISLSLKLCSKGLGLPPERVLTLCARMIGSGAPGMRGRTMGEVLEIFREYPAGFWFELETMAGRDKNVNKSNKAQP